MENFFGHLKAEMYHGEKFGSVKEFTEVPRVLFLGLCLVFHYFSTGVVFPKIGFYFSRRAVAQALVEP
nr:hypothetical protein CE91St29_03260 [Corynebacterium striatum]